MIDLNPNHLAIVKRILADHVPECEVWAFGSRASWTAKDYSDLDLAIVGDRPLDWRTLGLLKEAFEESDLPMRVDVLDWHDIVESFQRVIERYYVVLQEKAEGRSLVREGDWQETQLGNVIELKRGYDLPQRERVVGSIPLVSSSGITDFHSEAKVRGPGVVTGRYGTLGQVFFIEGDFWPLNTTLYVRDFKGNDPRFISYFLRRLDFSAYSDKAAVPGLNRNHLHQALVRFPADVSEQRAVAHVLGTLDDKIELNRRMNETLEEMARALFRSWFVDFDPVRAKMEGRWRSGESPPGLPSDLYGLFPDRLVPSELGGIPEGWEVRPLGEVVELNPSETMRKGTTAPYLDMAALPTTGSNPDDAIVREYTSGTRFRNGDTLVARITPCLENGKTAFVQSLPDDAAGWGSTEFIVLRATSPVPPAYTYLLARDDAFRAHAIQSMTGSSGRQRAKTEVLAQYLLAVPSAAVWREFAFLVEPIFHSIKMRSEEARTLATERDALLPKLVPGAILPLSSEKVDGN